MKFFTKQYVARDLFHEISEQERYFRTTPASQNNPPATSIPTWLWPTSCIPKPEDGDPSQDGDMSENGEPETTDTRFVSSTIAANFRYVIYQASIFLFRPFPGDVFWNPPFKVRDIYRDQTVPWKRRSKILRLILWEFQWRYWNYTNQETMH